MSTKTKRKSNVTYATSESGNVLYVVDDDNRVITEVCNWHDHLEVTYNRGHYGFPIGRVAIHEDGFTEYVKYAQAKYGVKFSIKTEWGTNASQSSDT